MKEIEFKTAKLAKEKGFNNKAKKFYLSELGLCYWGEDALVYENFKGFTGFLFDVNYEIDKNYGEKYFAPSLSELQLWIWNTHSIWVQSTPLFSANDCLGIVVSATSWKFSAKTFNYGGWDVQEALELGLCETLKLI